MFGKDYIFKIIKSFLSLILGTVILLVVGVFVWRFITSVPPAELTALTPDEKIVKAYSDGELKLVTQDQNNITRTEKNYGYFSVADVVFIPENIYCYSEWHGEPEIEVIYVSCFIHLDGIGYEPEIVCGDDSLADDIIDVSAHLSGERINIFEAYSRFYKVLERVFARLSPSVASFDKTLQTAIEYITDSWDKIESVGDIAEHCRVSESKLYHLFGGELGQTPIGFLNSIKINIAIELLENSDHSISCISRLAGFNSENHFRKIFSALTGTTPKKYRSGCRG